MKRGREPKHKSALEDSEEEDELPLRPAKSSRSTKTPPGRTRAPAPPVRQSRHALVEETDASEDDERLCHLWSSPSFLGGQVGQQLYVCAWDTAFIISIFWNYTEYSNCM